MGSDRTTAASAIVDDGGGERAGEAAFLVVHGEDPAGGPSTRAVPLEEGGTVSIGRAESNTLPVASDQVSRHHARVTRGGGEIAVEDLGSRNGTRVNGVAIAGRTRLVSGDEIAIGPLVAVVAVTSRARAARPADVVVVDPAMQRAMAMAQKVAPAPITVLVLGETGVGKEIVAAAIHRMSPRGARPMVAINCAAMPETLLESALFGHERGAFTGADRRQVGYFEAADGGSIFLDEVGEMPAALQAKLLRVLEQRAITRVGGTATIPVDVRVICATNRDLEEEVRRGRFREDLYFRLCGFTLAVPPLRQRVGDVAPLARQFARQFARKLGQPEAVLDAGAIAALERYDWPGNVRQLRNAVERAVVMATDGAVGLEHLPEEVLGDRDPGGGAGEAPASIVKARVAQVERQTAVEALEACGGNQSQAARRLGMSRWAFIRLMRKYDLA
ncbi:MAG TPA: sigma 54-interacting transcriptional regulator [Kofleriaceae bacterium]|nr:sigma 54-interacting transcriptional regulator [Kofleriaceae bacterium]